MTIIDGIVWLALAWAWAGATAVLMSRLETMGEGR
jgi:hypothetical protein